MKRWEAILIFGRDKDDWEKEEFNAPDYDTAMSIAMELSLIHISEPTRPY